MLGGDGFNVAAEQALKGGDVLCDLTHFVAVVWLDDECPYGPGCYSLRGDCPGHGCPLVVGADNWCALPALQVSHTRITLSSRIFQIY